MATEQELTLTSTDPTTAPPSPTFSSLDQAKADKQTDALIACNGATPQKTNPQIRLPSLKESFQDGYKNGAKLRVLCCTVGSHIIEKNTAYDYILMANAAAKDGIDIPIIAAFRTYETQAWLRSLRVNPNGSLTPDGVAHGVAAKPGYSNHQMGIALDIDVKMDIAAYKAKAYTPEYIWLAGDGTAAHPGHAAMFGFDHQEGAAVSEPWHWTHLQMKISGVAAYTAATGVEVLAADTAVAAGSLGLPGNVRSVMKTAHDKDVSYARSRGMTSSTRDDFRTAHAEFCANQSAGMSSDLSSYKVATLATDPKPFAATTLAAFSYNFATGLWDDRGAV